MKQRFLIRISLALSVLAVAGTGLSIYSTHSRTLNTSPAVDAASDAAPGTAAMRAYIDPETGALEVRAGTAASATPQKLDADTENALRHDDVGLVETHHPDGTVSVNLDGRFQSVSVLRMTEGGDVIECTDDAASADRVLRGQVTPEVK